ncbi:SDR family oxidoreductase [Bosea sp. (in: a-proteobacteria)]|jgi:NAD(P)-dependent dehydrogenase (short-subunit alcohol dehydrogenase family)|uniref:SDR family oxidoreductase n=1 Tax=Bosea sp. (in: a-proteobacteria) TaxID=1871050 RepID=UPI002DDD4138|nr:SDR family NAD(P)-dependent oxidoreductase [Bosea sp. (in: a-proteobacteria)]HEV2512124.1 SDR family NAD(P)-dependent oxidoreductase [Bosea sp. (in: a-proteobacteria)]
MQELSGKTVLVTGAASGIGLAIAKSFLAAGSRLALADIDEDRLERAAADCERIGPAATPIRLDVASEASWAQALREIEGRLGPVDILCNNAGIGSARQPFGQMTPEAWRRVFDINVHGVFYGVSAILPGMLKRASAAHIVNTASILGHFARPDVGEYVAAKYAVLGLSETLRMELADTRVGVSVLCPGMVSTRIGQPSGSHGEPGPVAPASPQAGARPQGLEADRVGDAVVAAVREGRFYIFTHPEYAGLLGQRFDEIGQALASSAALGPAEDVSYLGSGFSRG